MERLRVELAEAHEVIRVGLGPEVPAERIREAVGRRGSDDE